jgi:primosomal protein N' (replication factor Y)
MEGEVIVQTFSPASPSIQHARHHDYAGFFEQETEFRKVFRHPPFTRLLLVQIRGKDQEKAFSAARSLAEVFKKKASSAVEVSEAAAAPLEKAHGQYRFHVTLKSSSPTLLGKLARTVARETALPEGVIMTMDVDPYSLM